MATTKPIAAQFKLTSPGKTLADADYLRNAILNMNSASSTYGIVAAGTTQATATQLASVLNQVDTAAASTGVNLPLSTGRHDSAYQFCVIVNNGANAIQVYASQGGSDTINGAAAATGVTQTAGTSVLYISAKGGAWFTIGQVDAIPSANRGTFVATGSSVTVANANITANSVVTFGLKTQGGTIAGAPFMLTVTPGTGFTVNAGGSDTSTYNYAIFG